ncbi:phospholipase A and acyltransferase 3-like isoform X2 [Xyrauchen texanus]|nr:phospholipase A and acyltransferase 3-like isoform X2 [Xyrauchen texanus]
MAEFKVKNDVKPEPGDLIEIKRVVPMVFPDIPFIYQHWAIYVGDGFVIHLATDSEYAGASSVLFVLSYKAMVKKNKIWDVVGDDEWRINNLLDNEYKHLCVEDVIREAESLVGQIQPYNVLTANCEHFVTKRRYGIAKSRQV